MAKLRAKMFNFRPYLNTKTVERFQPMVDTIVRDMTDEELLEAHKALNLLVSTFAGEQIRRDESASKSADSVPFCDVHRVWHAGTCLEWDRYLKTDPESRNWADANTPTEFVSGINRQNDRIDKPSAGYPHDPTC